MPLRFPNPGSDLERMLVIARMVVETVEREGLKTFELDDMVRIATTNYQASARGTMGPAAVSKSFTKDRSLDPLYNQLKMYSEIYRMLGIIRPTDKKLIFRTTTFGQVLLLDIDPQGPEFSQLVQEAIVAITFPNPVIDSQGVETHRPFRWILRLALLCDGVLTRDEIILTALSVENDRETSCDLAESRVRKLRKRGLISLERELVRYATASDVQLNTLKNYTRFPIGVMTSRLTNWATAERLDIYEKPVKALVLSEYGRKKAADYWSRKDIRSADLEGIDHSERVRFSQFAYWAMLQRSGVKGEVEIELATSKDSVESLLKAYGISSSDSFVYSPALEESEEVLRDAESHG
jgi:hypothetical protein